jgi:hypothetical protein
MRSAYPVMMIEATALNVIASEAKQSRGRQEKAWIASSLTLLAMTET